MNIYKQGFKENIIDTIFRTAGKVWLKITAAHSIYTFAVVVSMVILLKGILGIDLAFLENLQKPEELQLMINNFDLSFLTPGFLFLLLIIFVIVGVIATWDFYFALILTDDQINNDRVDFRETLSRSVNIDVIRLFGVAVLMNLVFVIGCLLVAKASLLSGKLAVLLAIACMVGFFRFILVVPGFIIGRRSLKDSFLFSVTVIDWVKALKLFCVFILYVIMLVIVAIIISLVSMIFAVIPVLGPLIQLGIQIFFGSFLLAISVSVFIGLYYRYVEYSVEEEGIESVLE